MVIIKYLEKLNKLAYKGFFQDFSEVEPILDQIQTELLYEGVSLKDTNQLIDSIKKRLHKPPYSYNKVKNVMIDILYNKICNKNYTINLTNLGPYNKIIIILVGYTGVGKTTTIMKLCNFYKSMSCGVICTDTERFGAIDQIRQNCRKVNVPCFYDITGDDPRTIAMDGMMIFRKRRLVFIDTAGIDEKNDTLSKIISIKNSIINKYGHVHEIRVYHVLDNSSSSGTTKSLIKQLEPLNIYGHILTKTDIGISLGILIAIKKPLLFIGDGEHLDNLKRYNAKKTFSKLFGLKADENAVQLKTLMKQSKIMNEKIMSGKATLSDFYNSIMLMYKGDLGIVESIAGMFMKDAPTSMINEAMTYNLKYKYIMDSMTKVELGDVNYSRYFSSPSHVKRWCIGSGTKPSQVNDLLTIVKTTQKVVKSHHNMTKHKRAKPRKNCGCKNCQRARQMGFLK